MKTLEQRMKQLSVARRRNIETRAAQLVAEEMSLRALRQAHKLTQQRMAQSLGITQDGISRLEKRSDLLISTLRSYVKAIGGRLSLVVEFPDRQPVVLSGIAEIATERPAQTKLKASTKKHAHAEAH